MDFQREIARRIVIGLPPEGLGAEGERAFASSPPAGVILFRRDFADLEDLRRLTSRLRELARPARILIAMDEEGGFVSQLQGLLETPPNAALLARGAEPGDLEWIARVTAGRLRALGVDWPLAPVADVNALPANPVIGPRAFGTEPASAARAVAEAVRGFRAGGAACCLKHFPGHGSTGVDSHLALPVCDADPATLEERDLAPFRAGIAAGAHAVMTAHVLYPALDRDRPATFSRAIVTDRLRRGLGFPGVVITDALEMKGATGETRPFDAAARALAAGCDLLLFAHHDRTLPELRARLVTAAAEGRLEGADFDAARARIESLQRACPEPDASELSRPLDSLTPPGWAERLEAIAARGLVVRGTLPREAAARPWRIEEPEWPDGPGFRGCLARAGLPLDRLVGGAGDPRAETVGFVALRSRLPLAENEIERLRASCGARPTVLVGVQNDAFLDALPEAAVRISAADGTPLTRRVVARAVARAWREAGGA
ncbi:MAG TPA: glycoside hydrolase family 3 N-terminal domain-containing protein [Terriglobales bacterium]|nr:glycoside hydrolase family 3 N-terminal domain-containing protein [Terriglobales bacterium]